MKEIVLKLYEFDELSKDSQERIIERERWNIDLREKHPRCHGWRYRWSRRVWVGSRGRQGAALARWLG